MDSRLLQTTAGHWPMHHQGAFFAFGVAVFAISTAPAAPRAFSAQEQLPALHEARLTQYRAFRKMHVRNEKFNHEAWIDAWTELDGTLFRYEITSERGSEYIRNKVLKQMLTREQELVNNGEAGRAEISPENYLFEEAAGIQESGFRYVLLKPKRKDMLLVNGRMVLNPDGTELLRVEGTLAKNPSFWTSSVDVVREFAVVDGVRVPVSTATVAKLKLAGQAHMDVRYEYESINGRQVDASSTHRATSVVGGPQAGGCSIVNQGTAPISGTSRASARLDRAGVWGGAPR
jgi:hypothetical protein